MEPIANHYPLICCWNCEHFQRYDQTSPFPKKCDGECRARPIAGAYLTVALVPENEKKFGIESETAFSFPYVPCGLRGRCSSFKTTHEKGNPKSPMSLDCQKEPPSISARWEPWIKPGRESCHTCNWFEPEYCQRRVKAQPDNGACLYYPPRPRRHYWFERFLPRFDIGVYPTIQRAGSLWCSQWDGPRPEFQIGPDPEPVKSADDFHARWKKRRARVLDQTRLTLESLGPRPPAEPLKSVDTDPKPADDQPAGGPV